MEISDKEYLNKNDKKKNTLDLKNINTILKTNYIDNSKKVKIYYYFYFLRIISSFAVVLIHVTAEFFYQLDINSFDYKIIFFYNGLSRFAVPIFYMISGTLFLSRDISYKTMYSKYTKKLLIHLLIWSFIYSISNIKLSLQNIELIFIEFINIHYHLKFLLSLIGLYILVPFLREITKKEELLTIFIILSFIFTFLFPNFNILLSYFSNEYFNRLDSIYKFLNLNYISGNVFYFMFGYYLNIKDISFYQKIFIYIFGLFGAYYTTGISHKIGLRRKEKFHCFYPLCLNIASYTTSVFIFIKNQFDNKNYDGKMNLIKFISNNTFGIYLVHPLILDNIRQFIIYKIAFIKILFRIPIIIKNNFLKNSI
jgi:surface polysaccharide O-acyltransferase-like enzyme